MTAIIYEIKHNSALRQVGQLSRSLNKSSLFTAHNNLIVKYQYHVPVILTIKKLVIDSLIFLLHFLIVNIQTKWNMGKLCNLEALPTQAVFCGWSLTKLFNLRCYCSWLEEPARSEKCQCQDSMHALGAFASSKQLLQMVCSLCHPRSQHCLWEEQLTDSADTDKSISFSKRKIREVDWVMRSFITSGTSSSHTL